ncbi:Protein CBG23182 [Caenorhabditis briggsae]|uniref:Protein CBG23182 n=1 Tax=Caenorhabditis briggsae TaxID=6238 RepID=A8Y4I2_CAEBR|nr:Protein CBG23182 [Caenorhabditis briggsae]CAP39802.1 Protein CBG23182 [Caenorhabditis briggsae]
MVLLSCTFSMSSPVSVHVAERIMCAVVGPSGEWKERVRFSRWFSTDDKWTLEPRSSAHLLGSDNRPY